LQIESSRRFILGAFLGILEGLLVQIAKVLSGVLWGGVAGRRFVPSSHLKMISLLRVSTLISRGGAPGMMPPDGVRECPCT